MIMGDLARIDWQNHDGVNLSMINDFVRNQFYDRALANCRDHCIVDIGFGTGLLSMLALKHGAQRVVAFESDADRFLLGQTIIHNLGLENRIELRHLRYDHTMQEEFEGWTFVTETVNGNLWQEGIWHSLPRQAGSRFIPGMMGLEVFVTVIPDSFASALGIATTDQKVFAPGVDIDPAFVREVNTQMSAGTVPDCSDLPRGLTTFDHEVDTVWGWIPYMRCFNRDSTPCAQYHLDIDRAAWRDAHGSLGPVDFDQTHAELLLTLPQDHAVLSLPRAVLRHGEQSLYLDMGHWGPCRQPCIVNRSQDRLRITHDLVNGDIDYQLV